MTNPIHAGGPPRMTVDQLRAAVLDGSVDTVIVAFCDMQGRLTGKRISARLFVDDVAAPFTSVNGYLPAQTATPDPARIAALAAAPDRRQWWIERITACFPLVS